MSALVTRIHDLDRRWLISVARRQPPHVVDRFLRLITHAGGATVTIGVALVLMLYGPSRALGMTLLIANAGSHVLVQIIKRTAGRPRPHFPDDSVIALVAHPDEFSLPSGHSAAAMALAMTLTLWNGAPVIPSALAATALVVALVVGFSRIYLRVHFVTDVLLGQFIGIIGAILVTW